MAKSRGNLVEDENLDWLKPRTLVKPDDQEEVPEAVRSRFAIQHNFYASFYLFYN